MKWVWTWRKALLNLIINHRLKRFSLKHHLKHAYTQTDEGDLWLIKKAPQSMIVQKLGILSWQKNEFKFDIDYKRTTDKSAAGTWFAFPWRVDDPAFDCLLLFNKFKSIAGAKARSCLLGYSAYEWKQVAALTIRWEYPSSGVVRSELKMCPIKMSSDLVFSMRTSTRVIDFAEHTNNGQ